MLRFLTAGESHGPALVAILEGMPAGVPLDRETIDHQLRRRQGGYGRGHRMALESDAVDLLSGVRHGLTLGTPIALLVRNKDWPNWQHTMAAEAVPPEDAGGARRAPVTRPRPGHADLAGAFKYGHDDLRNVLERASARETAARVAAGACARQFLAQCGIEIVSHVTGIGGVPRRPSGAVPFDVVAARTTISRGNAWRPSTRRELPVIHSAAASKCWPEASRLAWEATCSGTDASTDGSPKPSCPSRPSRPWRSETAWRRRRSPAPSCTT
jgi:chorismate synthase